MTRHSDVERVLHEYLADEGEAAPDRVLHVVEDRIRLQPQRRDWRLHRSLSMSTYARLVAALAAAVVLALVGYGLLPRDANGPVTPTPTSNPTATPTATAAKSKAPPTFILTDGALIAGRYRTDSFGVTATFDVPAGWSGIGDWALMSPAGLAPPNGLGIAFIQPTGVFSDPCHWDIAGSGVVAQVPDINAPGHSWSNLVKIVKAQKAYQVTTLRGLHFQALVDGEQLRLRFPADLDPKTCDVPRGSDAGIYLPFSSIIEPGVPKGPNLYAQGPGQIWDAWILDDTVEGWAMIVNYYPGTDRALLGQAESILLSMQFAGH